MDRTLRSMWSHKNVVKAFCSPAVCCQRWSVCMVQSKNIDEPTLLDESIDAAIMLLIL